MDTARPIPALCPSLRVPPRLNSSNTRDSVGRDARAVVTHSNAHLTIVAVDGQPHVSSVRACTPPRSAAPLRHRHAFSDDHTDVEPFAMQLERASKNLRHLGHIADEPRDVAPPRAVVAVRARASREKASTERVIDSARSGPSCSCSSCCCVSASVRRSSTEFLGSEANRLSAGRARSPDCLDIGAFLTNRRREAKPIRRERIRNPIHDSFEKTNSARPHRPS